jgi:hypothetical protein
VKQRKVLNRNDDGKREDVEMCSATGQPPEKTSHINMKGNQKGENTEAGRKEK